MTAVLEWKERLKQAAPGAPVDRLTLERVTVHKREGRIVVRFQAGQILTQQEYASVKQGLAEMFGKRSGLAVDVFVACPTLADDFLADPEKYAAWLTDALCAQMPSARPHLSGASWTVEKNTVTLTVRAKIAADLLLLRRADEVIGKILSQVFRRDAAVQIISREQERELKSFLEERRRMDAELLKHMGDQVKEKKKPEGPRVLYGRKITGSTFDPIGDLNETSGRVCVEGFVLKKIESKELRGGSKTLVTSGRRTTRGAILCKVFLNAEQGEGKEIQGLKAGIRVRVRGACQWDSFSKEIALMADDVQQMPWTPRRDEEEVKRVELHLHTQMSNMDGVTSAAALIKRAAEWGHEAIAITDHGVVQAYPEAFDTVKSSKGRQEHQAHPRHGGLPHRRQRRHRQQPGRRQRGPRLRRAGHRDNGPVRGQGPHHRDRRGQDRRRRQDPGRVPHHGQPGDAHPAGDHPGPRHHGRHGGRRPAHRRGHAAACRLLPRIRGLCAQRLL